MLSLTGKHAGAYARVFEPGFRLFEARENGGVATPWKAYIDPTWGVRESRSGTIFHEHGDGEHGRSGGKRMLAMKIITCLNSV